MNIMDFNYNYDVGDNQAQTAPNLKKKKESTVTKKHNSLEQHDTLKPLSTCPVLYVSQ